MDDIYEERIAALMKVIHAKKVAKEDNIPCQIEEGLYLGSIGAASNRSALKSLNITHILTVANSLAPAHPNDFVYKIIQVNDRKGVTISQYFDECFKFIEEARMTGGGVLVHCFAGRSRSVTIVVAYLMFKNDMSLSEAMAYVRTKRPVASPNSGFMLQLQEYERSLRDRDFIEMARAKALERIRGTGSTGRPEYSRGSSQAPSTGRQTTQASQRRPKPRAFVEQTKETKQRHRASPPLEQPSAKRTALEKEKGVADGSANPMEDASQSLPGLNIPEWTRRQREGMFDLPELSDPRFFDVSNSHSVFLDPFGRATLDSFRAVLFEKDHERLSGQKTSNLLRLNAFFTLAQIQASYELARRSLSYDRDAKALTERIEELEASSSPKRVEELEARLVVAKSKVTDLEHRQKEAEDALKRADTQLLDAVQEKSRLSERIDQLRVEALEARKIREAYGQQNEREAMERFYQGKQPELCLKAAEDFLHSPVFQMVSLLIGSNDQLSGWMKALGQLRRQGVEFDESKLDMGLDEFGNPYPEDDDDDIPQVDGTEFEPLMPAIHKMARAAEEKEANLAEARRLNADGMSTPIPVVQDPATEVEPPTVVVQVEELDHEVVDVPSS